MMNAFDTNFDAENEVYAVNTVAHCLRQAPDPDRPRAGRCASIWSTSIEFDPINSFHLHANFFDYYDPGTTLTPTLRTVDLIMQCQAQRGILEFTYKDHEPGLYMFHAAPVRVRRARLDGHVRCRGGRGMNDARLGWPPPQRVRRRRTRRLCSGLSCRWSCSALAICLARSRPIRCSSFNNGAPPVEKLTFERTILVARRHRRPGRAGGSEPMTIAQVQVDDAYWQFTQEPPGPIARGATAWIAMPFPWVLGEAHAINIVTTTGATFEQRSPSRCRRRRRDAGELAAAGAARHLRRHCRWRSA